MGSLPPQLARRTSILDVNGLGSGPRRADEALNMVDAWEAWAKDFCIAPHARATAIVFIVIDYTFHKKNFKKLTLTEHLHHTFELTCLVLKTFETPPACIALSDILLHLCDSLVCQSPATVAMSRSTAMRAWKMQLRCLQVLPVCLSELRM